MRFSLDPATGAFRDARGARVIPLGVNYWPGSCGVEMWREWPEEEIRRDLDLVCGLGLNTVRFFLRWQDFEPEEGRHNEAMFDRLEMLLGWHRDRGLLAHPSLFVGWMSGGIFWPDWHRGRNVFADSALRARAVALASRSATVCAGFPDTVLAVDQGNELCCLPENQEARPAAVAEWCRDIAGAVKRAFPGALVVSGNEQTQVIADSGWRFGAQAPCDFYSMHSYPVSAWHSLAFDGMTDPLAQSLLPFYVKCARAWGPVMVQEFGTLLTRGARGCDSYLRAVLPACRKAGANGFLWWCLRDIAAGGHPYDKNAFEGLLGLVDAAGKIKPGLEFFLEFARTIQDGNQTLRTEFLVALYWPLEYYPRDNPRNPGNDPRHLSRQMAVAHFAAEEAGRSCIVVRHDALPEPANAPLLIIAGAKLTAPEVHELEGWVRAGGRLIWHGPDAMTWGAATERLIGAEPIDFRAPRAEGVALFGSVWNFRHFPRDIFLQVRPRNAIVIAADAEERPVVLAHDLGKGRVITCMAEIDAAFATQSDFKAVRADWARWYRGMFGLV